MVTTSLADDIAITKSEFEIIPADNDILRHEAYRLRYQVYCVENNFLSGINGLEMDEYDAHAQHMILCHRQSGTIVGTVRLVLPKADRSEESFPILRFYNISLSKELHLARCGEGSRFAISRHRLSFMRSIPHVLRLWLIQGVVRMSLKAGHTHILAILDPRLLRLFRMNGINFHKLGPTVEYHGCRQPAFIETATMLAEVRSTHPQIWEVMTDGERHTEPVATHLSRAETIPPFAEALS
ncbi:MAG: GNAT family N-acetyltransferase [Acidibrevibacterium sp.]|jgi:N-acyl-L-homoserine lactone synthetase|uniref:GNAT family N-acyltransferase n=1 Tax=Acidibrevibacterium fodinaquatile TaxID=1969806 RepID=UPI000E0D830E|nr:GNAT family N-acyltransferase [Acidibrevibacterium fodinaquatile]MCA7118607.1 GNAT family N-acetyltransferase [Acidibrevibacterium fodinaquatile]